MRTLGRRDLLALGLAAAAASLSSPALASDLLSDIAKARSSLRTLVARFRQKRTLSLLATAVSSTGELTLVRPDRLRWELFPPDSITYWAGPWGLAFASTKSQGATDRASAGSLATVLGDLMVVLGGDLSKLSPRYELRASREGDGSAQVSATPREARLLKAFKRLDITLEKDLVSPREITIVEPGTDKVQIRFDPAKLNVSVPTNRMTPPKGSRK